VSFSGAVEEETDAGMEARSGCNNETTTHVAGEWTCHNPLDVPLSLAGRYVLFTRVFGSLAEEYAPFNEINN
jgi:hypothetical protein